MISYTGVSNASLTSVNSDLQISISSLTMESLVSSNITIFNNVLFKKTNKPTEWSLKFLRQAEYGAQMYLKQLFSFCGYITNFICTQLLPVNTKQK